MINRFEGRWSFLSNFYPSEILHNGIKYPTVEHYYVAMKINSPQIIDGIQYTLDDARVYISKIENPSLVKRLGRTKLQIRKDWDDVRLKSMEWGLRQKFSKDPLLQMLIDTNDHDLVEGNTWHDNFFGSCTCEKCGNRGNNHLGKLLMMIRSEML